MVTTEGGPEGVMEARATQCVAVGMEFEAITRVLVRASQTLDGKKMGYLYKGDKVEILVVGRNNRVRIRAANGSEGWASIAKETGEQLLRPARKELCQCEDDHSVQTEDSHSGPPSEGEQSDEHTVEDGSKSLKFEYFSKSAGDNDNSSAPEADITADAQVMVVEELQTISEEQDSFKLQPTLIGTPSVTDIQQTQASWLDSQSRAAMFCSSDCVVESFSNVDFAASEMAVTPSPWSRISMVEESAIDTSRRVQDQNTNKEHHKGGEESKKAPDTMDFSSAPSMRLDDGWTLLRETWQSSLNAQPATCHSNLELIPAAAYPSPGTFDRPRTQNIQSNIPVTSSAMSWPSWAGSSRKAMQFAISIVSGPSKSRPWIRRKCLPTSEAAVEPEVQCNIQTPSTSRKVLGHKVLVFGLGADKRRVSASPVILKDLPVKAKSVDFGLHLREVGLTLSGAYTWLGFEAPNVWYVEWVPPGHFDDKAKRLETILEGAARVRLIIPGTREIEMVEVSLTNAHDIHWTTTGHQVIPCAPRDSAYPHGSFRRLVTEAVQDTNFQVPTPLLSGEGATMRGYAEAGEIIAYTLTLRLQHDEDDMDPDCWLHELQEAIRLFYFASLGLLQAVFGTNVRDAVRMYWEQQLQLDAVDRFSMTDVQRGTRTVIRDLLMACSCDGSDRYCAVLPAGFIPELQAMFKRTRHPYVCLRIEQGNFDSRINEIEDRLADCAITFILITICGPMSPQQLNSLVQRARGCLRLILVANPTLQRSLALSGCESKVLFAESLSKGGSLSCQLPYRINRAVGTAVVRADTILLAQPEALSQSSPTLGWHLNWQLLKAELTLRTKWQKEIESWQVAGNTFLHLITSDIPLTKAFFQAMGANLFDADNTALEVAQPFCWIHSTLDRLAWQANSQKHSDGDAVASPSLMVVFNHQLVAKRDIEHVVSRCLDGGQQLVFVATAPSVDLLCMPLRGAGRHATIVRPQLLHARLTPDDLIAHVSCSCTERAEEVRKKLHAIHLVFGPDKMTTQIARLALGLHDAESCMSCAAWTDLVSVLAGSNAPERRQCIVEEVLMGIFGLDLGHSSLAWTVGAASGATCSSVAFKEFVRMPVCRFLSQIHRLESWLRYIDPTLPASCHTVAAFNPTSNCHSNDVLELLSSASGSTAQKMLVPSFDVIEKANSLVNIQELHLHYAMQGLDLDWESLAEQWSSMSPPDAAELSQLFDLSCDVMKLALCIAPSSVVHIGDACCSDSNCNLMQRLHMNFVAAAPILCLCSQPLLNASNELHNQGSLGVDDLQDKMAAIKYVLLHQELGFRNDVYQDGHVTEEFSVLELNRLFRHHIRVSAIRGHKWMQKLLAIDEPRSLFVEQPELRNFLLNGASDDVMEDLSTAPVGAAFAELLAMPLIRQKLVRDKTSPLMRIPLFSEIFAWLGNQSETLASCKGLACGAHRLSAAALASVLVHTPTLSAQRSFVRCVIWEACAADQAKKAHLVNTLSAEPGSKHLVVPVLEVLVDCEQETRCLNGQEKDVTEFIDALVDPALRVLYAALTTKDLEPYFAFDNPPPLVLDTSNTLVDLVIAYFRCQNSASMCRTLKGISASSCSALVLRLLAMHEPPRPLLWYCWGRDPSIDLPTNYLPRDEERCVFLDALQIADFSSFAGSVREGLSTIARMIARPHTLTLAVFNLLEPHLAWIHASPWVGIEQKVLVVAQDSDFSDYPPYCLRWHYRPLPKLVKQQMLDALHGMIHPMPDHVPLAHIFPRLTEGISKETCQYNVSLLFSLASRMSQQGGRLANHCAMLGACVFAWFKAAGLQKEELVWCIAPSCQILFKEAWIALQKMQVDSLRTQYTAGPLPAYIDVRWVGDEQTIQAKLFTISKASAQITAQWLNNVCYHAKLKIPFFQASDLVKAVGPHDGDVIEGPRYKDALVDVASAWGSSVADLLLASKLIIRMPSSINAEPHFDITGLTNYFIILADLSKLLREQSHKLEAFLSKLICSLAERLHRPAPRGVGWNQDLISSIMYEVFFLLFGITPDNHGLEMKFVTQAFSAAGLKGSKNASREMKWLHSNFYITKCSARDNLAELLQLDIPVYEFKQHHGSIRPITQVSVESSPLLRSLKPPSYVNPTHFSLNCGRKGNLQNACLHEADEVESQLCEKRETKRFFQSTPIVPDVDYAVAPIEVQHESGEVQAVVAVGDILEVETSPKFWHYARVRVAPGLQTILYQDDPDVPAFRLTSKESSQSSGKRQTCSAPETISHVFPHNGDAWKFLNKLKSRSTLIADSLYFTKADDDKTWVPILASNHENGGVVWDEGDALRIVDQKFCIWPFVFSHNLVNLGLDGTVLNLLGLIVTLAFNLAEGRSKDRVQTSPHEINCHINSKVCEVLHQISRLSAAIESQRVTPAEQKALLARYQHHEHGICSCILEVVKRVTGANTVRDIIDSILDVCSNVPAPFVESDSDGAMQVTELGVHVAQQLSLICCKLDTSPRKQLCTILSRAALSIGIPSHQLAVGPDKKITPHHRIHLKSFEEQCMLLQEKLARIPEMDYIKLASNAKQLDREVPLERKKRGQLNEADLDIIDEAESGPKDATVLQGTQEWMQSAPSWNMKKGSRKNTRKTSYDVDSIIDQGDKNNSWLFTNTLGFGRPTRNRFAVRNFFDADSPLYFVSLETEKLHIDYNMADGLPLGFLLHRKLIFGLLVSALNSPGGSDLACVLRCQLLAWISDILRSPLPDSLKSWILQKIESQGHNPQRPPPVVLVCLIIAYSLCSCCPAATAQSQFLRKVLMESLRSSVQGVGISPTVERLIQRKEGYGVYVVKNGTLLDLQHLFGTENVIVRDFQREITRESLSISSMYLDIVNCFSQCAFVVYIRGLRLLEDALLKWLAEYSRHHPWRFIFLENVDTTWNFSENRDRCNFSFDGENPTAGISSIDEINKAEAAFARACHKVDYTKLPIFKHMCKSATQLLAAFRQHLPSRFLDELPLSITVQDFRQELDAILRRPDPCVAMIVSPPGAGKTFFMDSFRSRLESSGHIHVVQFDGSSDVLVRHTITELLDKAVPANGRQALLILDEYHMLVETQKSHLFNWIKSKASSIQVVLIANRIDAKDRERMNSCGSNACLIEARLSRRVLDEKLDSIGIDVIDRENLHLWYTCSRLVFGEESISLRLVDRVVQALRSHNPQKLLEEVLLNKVPTASRAAVQQFVMAFLAHVDGKVFAGGPFAVVFNVAALDSDSDSACSYHEFCNRMPDALLLTSPAVRLLCWSTYILAAKAKEQTENVHNQLAKIPSDINLSCLCDHQYIDQVGTPFLLCQPPHSTFSGYAFSWSGNYESIDDIIDATKRGHSIDWLDVHEKTWKTKMVTDSHKVCILLSSCRNPGPCLEAFTSANLALLMRSSSPDNSVLLARHVLSHWSHNPSYVSLCGQAMWVLILNDASITHGAELVKLTDDATLVQLCGPGAWCSEQERTVGHKTAPRLLAFLEWAQEHATDCRYINRSLGATDREQLLRQALVLATLCSGATLEQQSRLWSGIFAQLLELPTEESERKWRCRAREPVICEALPVSCLRSWLASCDAFEREWPHEVKSLWSVLHGRAPASIINFLWETYSQLLCEASTGKLSQAVLLGVVHNDGGELDKDLQRSILLSSCTIAAEISDRDLLCVTATALRLIDKTDLPADSDPRIVRMVEGELARGRSC